MTQQQDDPLLSDDSQKKVQQISLEGLQEKIKELEKEQAHEPAGIPTPGDQQKIEELTNALTRTVADLQNFKRRTEEERRQWMKVAQADLLKILLPILDHFDRSSQHLPKDLKNNDWAKGVMHVHDELIKTFDKLGIKKMETVGKKIDPKIHEAIRTTPGEKDVIQEEYEAGYWLGDLIIKPARVSVGDGTLDNKN